MPSGWVCRLVLRLSVVSVAHRQHHPAAHEVQVNAEVITSRSVEANACRQRRFRPNELHSRQTCLIGTTSTSRSTSLKSLTFMVSTGMPATAAVAAICRSIRRGRGLRPARRTSEAICP